MAFVLRRLGWLPVALERARGLAGLGVVFTSPEWPEEPTFGHELSAAVRAPLRRQPGQVVRLCDEALHLHRVERLLERPVKLGENAAPWHSPFLHLVQLTLHLGGEADVEDV